jgi:hypothetical protein
MIKLLINQISSLRNLEFYSYLQPIIPNFALFPRAKDCLKNLTELHCNSGACSELFCELSKICHNIQLLDMEFTQAVSNEVKDLITSQQNLKYLKLLCYNGEEFTTGIDTLLAQLPDKLIKLNIQVDGRIPVSFISKFMHLQEITITFEYPFIDFERLLHVNFSQLQVLKFQYMYPSYDLLIKFLENNGKNLKEFYVDNGNNSLDLAMVEFCPNLKKLFTGLASDELETLKVIFNSYQNLESIKVRCKDGHSNEKGLLEVIVKYAPASFYELRLSYLHRTQSKLLPEELESFFINWGKRVPRRSLSLIIIRDDIDDILYSRISRGEYMEIIEKYTGLGIIKKFKIIEYDFEDFNDDV